MNKLMYTVVSVAGLIGSLEARADFLEDGTATLGLRNFYINQDQRNQHSASTKEWGQAFMLDYKSGYTDGVIGVGLDVFGTYGLRLDDGGRDGKAGETRVPGSSFPLESNGRARRDFARLGLTAKLRYSKTELHVGTLRPKLPVVIYNDGRLLPETFEGYQITSRDLDRFVFTVGKLERSTERNSTDSDTLSIIGSNNRETGKFSNKFYYGGFDYKVNKDLTVQYYFGKLQDFYQQHFLGLIHNIALPVGALKTDLRYYNSDSTGKNASAAGRAEGYRATGYWSSGNSNQYEVDNRLWSALFTYSLKGHALSAGYQSVTGHSDFPSLQQGAGRTLYLITNSNIQGAKFASAGEKTWVAGYAYDFAQLGVPGLKASTTYYHGSNIDAKGSDNREWGRDINLMYEVQTGTLKGLGFAWRNGIWRGNDTGSSVVDRDENRLTVSYNLKLF